MILDRETLTLEELAVLIERAHLTPQQAAFIEAGVSSGDWKWAASQAYQIKDQDTARKSAHSLMRRAPVRDVLDAYFKKTPREILLDDLRYANTPMKLRALQAKAALLGVRLDVPASGETAKHETKSSVGPAEPEVKTAAPEAASARLKVGSIIEQDSVQYEVLALDADGEVSKVRDVATGKIYPEEKS